MKEITEIKDEVEKISNELIECNLNNETLNKAINHLVIAYKLLCVYIWNQPPWD